MRKSRERSKNMEIVFTVLILLLDFFFSKIFVSQGAV